MIVESAVGEAGFLHEIREGDAVHSLFPEKARRRREHAGPVRLRLLLADAHGRPSVGAAWTQ